MNYQEIQPPDHLRQWIRYFWVLENDSPNDSNQILSPLADGCPGIIFQHSSKGHFYDPYEKHLPEIFLYGQTIQPADLYLEGQFKSIGICLYPSALKSLFQFNASELTDSCLDLSLLIRQLKEPLLNSPTIADQIEIFSSHIEALTRKKDASVDRVTAYALTRIAESNGNISLRNLQKELQLSERGLQRKFDQHVGISPKLFARVCRFQATLAQLKNNNFNNLSDIAFDNGYADQSHFIRTFKEFAGFSPLQFQKSNRRLTANFSLL